MLSKAIRAAALAGAVVAVGTVSTTPASAFTVNLPFSNVAVSGTLTPKKLNQPVTLPEGSNFNGQVALELPAWSGPITGNLFVPPWNATVSILGVPTTVGLTLTQVGPVEGSLSREPLEACPGLPEGQICLTMSVPTHANLGITEAGLLGINVPTHCETSEPLTVPLHTTLSLFELLTVGAHFTGTITIPPIRCDGLDGIAVGLLLTTVMSGPDNPYELAIAAPHGRGF